MIDRMRTAWGLGAKPKSTEGVGIKGVLKV